MAWGKKNVQIHKAVNVFTEWKEICAQALHSVIPCFKSSQTVTQHMSRNVSVLRSTSPSHALTHFSAMLFVKAIKRIVRCTQDIQRTAELRYDQMIMESTQDEYCNMCRNSESIITDDAITQTVFHTAAVSSWDRKFNTHSTCGRSSPRLYREQPIRIHNCSCRARHMEKLLQ
jgi:hypothetical protein